MPRHLGHDALIYCIIGDDVLTLNLIYLGHDNNILYINSFRA